MPKQRIQDKPRLGGYSSLKKVPTQAVDYHRYLWVPKMNKGIPYLLVYETNRQGVDLGEEPINLGRLINIESAPCASKTSPAAKRINNIDDAITKSIGYVITVEAEDIEGDKLEKDVYVMIGNILDGELDEYYFPERVRTNTFMLDQQKVKSM